MEILSFSKIRTTFVRFKRIFRSLSIAHNKWKPVVNIYLFKGLAKNSSLYEKEKSRKVLSFLFFHVHCISFILLCNQNRTLKGPLFLHFSNIRKGFSRVYCLAKAPSFSFSLWEMVFSMRTPHWWGANAVGVPKSCQKIILIGLPSLNLLLWLLISLAVRNFFGSSDVVLENENRWNI